MNEEKMKEILEAMQGISYLEWTKIRFIIDRVFDSEADNYKRNLQIAAPEKIVSRYKQEYSL